MAEAIVKQVNDYPVKTLGRIRDRLRCDLMTEVWYIFDVVGLDLEEVVGPTKTGPIDLRQVPIVKVPKGVSEKQRKKTLPNICKGAVDARRRHSPSSTRSTCG